MDPQDEAREVVPGLMITDFAALQAWLQFSDTHRGQSTHHRECASWEEMQLCCLEKLRPSGSQTVLYSDADIEKERNDG
jgi:hypothetical protein